jgi:hypothetical protein
MNGNKYTWRHAQNVVSLRVLHNFFNLISILVIYLKFVFIEMLDKLITHGVFVQDFVSGLATVVILVHTTGKTWYKVLYHHTMYVMSIYWNLQFLIRVFIPSPTKLRRDIVTLPSVLPSFRNILVNTRINILQWILIKLGTYLKSLRESRTLLIFKVIGQRSSSPGQIFRRWDTPRFALPLLLLK